MWFIYALLTFFAWGTADLFYKKGSNPRDKYSHLKIVVSVGLVMGLHAIGYMTYLYIKDGWTFDIESIITYFPVSALYILSMVIGYVGLRYIQLSVASPVQNSSGAFTAILCLFFLSYRPTSLEIAGVIIIIAGVIGLGIIEKKMSDKELALSKTKIQKKYRIGFYAFLFPVLYAIIDALGTFFDGVWLDEEKPILSEENALVAYELTFFVCGIVALIFLIIRIKSKKNDYNYKFNIINEKDRIFAAIFETAGQFTYVLIIGGKSVIVAPIVGAYCIASVILSRIFLKEKLTQPQYICVITVILGLLLIGVSEGLG